MSSLIPGYRVQIRGYKIKQNNYFGNSDSVLTVALLIYPPNPLPLGKEGGIFTMGILLIAILYIKASTMDI